MRKSGLEYSTGLWILMRDPISRTTVALTRLGGEAGECGISASRPATPSASPASAGFCQHLRQLADTSRRGVRCCFWGDEAGCGARHVDQRPSGIGLSARRKAIAGSAAVTAASSSTSAAPAC